MKTRLKTLTSLPGPCRSFHERSMGNPVSVWLFQVNLAHQGMGDVMGSILADCLIELPLMRKLNLRDNRLTDKGLMPIVKASRGAVVVPM